jgi:hypothetical protein
MTARTKSKNTTPEWARDYALWMWAAYIFFFPIYVFSSGLPQPADILIIALTPIVFRRWNGRLPIAARRAVFALLVFVVYVVASNFLWSILTMTFTINLRFGFLLSPFFYLYNALVFVLALLMYKENGQAFIDMTVRAVLVTCIVQVPMSLALGHSTTLRASGMFNAPNQLGYYAVLSASIILLGQRRARIHAVYIAAGLLACSYLALISASKAALVSTGLIITLSLISRLWTVLLATLVAAVLFVAVDPVSEAVDRTMLRIQTDQSFGLLEERGYDRIVNNPEYWVLGAGEGGYIRFADTTVIQSHELHSSAGTVFFCYGIAGTLLFLLFVFQVVRVGDVKQVLLTLPVAAYGLSHQGLRVTLFWVFLALIVMMGTRQAMSRVKAKPKLPARSGEPAPAA